MESIRSIVPTKNSFNRTRERRKFKDKEMTEPESRRQTAMRTTLKITSKKKCNIKPA